MHALSDLAIDTWLAKTQEERKAFAEKVKENQESKVANF